jgi:hypothetical protein
MDEIHNNPVPLSSTELIRQQINMEKALLCWAKGYMNAEVPFSQRLHFATEAIQNHCRLWPRRMKHIDMTPVFQKNSEKQMVFCGVVIDERHNLTVVRSVGLNMDQPFQVSSYPIERKYDGRLTCRADYQGNGLKGLPYYVWNPKG